MTDVSHKFIIFFLYLEKVNFKQHKVKLSFG